MAGKKRRKVWTGIYLDCPCGAKAAVFASGDCKWFSHCVSCGRLTFWANPQLTERAKLGVQLCPHKPEPKTCKNGRAETSWCEMCRIRTFGPLAGE